MFMYCDLSIFPPDSSFIQVRLKQQYVNLYKIMLAIDNMRQCTHGIWNQWSVVLGIEARNLCE